MRVGKNVKFTFDNPGSNSEKPISSHVLLNGTFTICISCLLGLERGTFLFSVIDLGTTSVVHCSGTFGNEPQ